MKTSYKLGKSSYNSTPFDDFLSIIGIKFYSISLFYSFYNSLIYFLGISGGFNIASFLIAFLTPILLCNYMFSFLDPASDSLVPLLLILGLLPTGILSNPITKSYLSLSSSASSNSGISLFFTYKVVSELVIIGFDELKV